MGVVVKENPSDIFPEAFPWPPRTLWPQQFVKAGQFGLPLDRRTTLKLRQQDLQGGEGASREEVASCDLAPRIRKQAVKMEKRLALKGKEISLQGEYFKGAMEGEFVRLLQFDGKGDILLKIAEYNVLKTPDGREDCGPFDPLRDGEFIEPGKNLLPRHHAGQDQSPGLDLLHEGPVASHYALSTRTRRDLTPSNAFGSPVSLPKTLTGLAGRISFPWLAGVGPQKMQKADPGGQ